MNSDSFLSTALPLTSLVTMISATIGAVIVSVYSSRKKKIRRNEADIDAALKNFQRANVILSKVMGNIKSVDINDYDAMRAIISEIKFAEAARLNAVRQLEQSPHFKELMPNELRDEFVSQITRNTVHAEQLSETVKAIESLISEHNPGRT